jgi:hypothetical protein
VQIMTSVSDIMLLSNLQVKNKPHYKPQLLYVSCAWFGHEQLIFNCPTWTTNQASKIRTITRIWTKKNKRKDKDPAFIRDES